MGAHVVHWQVDNFRQRICNVIRIVDYQTILFWANFDGTPSIRKAAPPARKSLAQICCSSHRLKL